MADAQKRNRSIEVREDRVNHAREWATHRIAWFLFAGVLTASALGLTGNGPLASRTIGTPDSLIVIDFDRFGRYEAPAVLRINVAPQFGVGDTIRIRLGREFVERAHIERIDPEPLSQGVSRDGFTLDVHRVFGERAVVHVAYRAAAFGPMPLSLEVSGGVRLSASQFIFP